jgi:hypothetical protein
MKLQLVYLKEKGMACISHAHYDLCTIEKEPKNVACILTDKSGARLLRSWIKSYNESQGDKNG